MKKVFLISILASCVLAMSGGMSMDMGGMGAGSGSIKGDESGMEMSGSVEMGGVKMEANMSIPWGGSGSSDSFNVVAKDSNLTTEGQKDPLSDSEVENYLHTQTVNQNFTVKVVHLNGDDNKTLTKTKATVTLELIENPATSGATCDSATPLKGTTVKFSFSIVDSMMPGKMFAHAIVSVPFKYEKAIRDAKFRVKYNGKYYCSRDNFAIKPELKIGFPDSIKHSEGGKEFFAVKQNHNIPLNLALIEYEKKCIGPTCMMPPFYQESLFSDYDKSSDYLNVELNSTSHQRVYPLMYDFRIVGGVIDEKYIRYPEENKLQFIIIEKPNDEDPEFAVVDRKDTPDEQRLIKGVSPEITIYKTRSYYYAGQGTGETENDPSKMTYTSKIKSKTDRVYHKLGW